MLLTGKMCIIAILTRDKPIPHEFVTILRLKNAYLWVHYIGLREDFRETRLKRLFISSNRSVTECDRMNFLIDVWQKESLTAISV